MSGAPTYESTLKHYGLTDEQMQVECSDGVILALVQHMRGWRNIAPYLEVDDSVVDAIVNEPTTDDEGKRRKFLERWKEKFGHVATLERLTRCFISSGKAALADVVCEERKKTLPPPSAGPVSSTTDYGCKETLPSASEKSSTVEPPETPDCHPFTVQSQQATEEHTGRSDSRDTAAINKHMPDTIGVEKPQQRPNPRFRHTSSAASTVSLDPISEQEQSNEHQPSDMVTPNPLSTGPPPQRLPKSPALPPDPNRVVEIWLALLNREKDEKDTVQNQLCAKELTVEHLLKQKEDLEEYLTDKKKRIEQLEEETLHMQQKLTMEKRKSQEVFEDLTMREKRIDCLREDVFQKDRELKQEKEEMQARIWVLEEQLKRTLDKLKKKRYEEFHRATVEADTTRKETEGIERVLKCMDRNLKELQNEIERLKREKHQRKIAGVVVYFILAALLVALLAIGFHRLQCATEQ